MTTGQVLFYAGVGLLTVAIVLAVIFAVKKPEYHPENAAILPGDAHTTPLRNGYPTDPLTVRRENTGKTAHVREAKTSAAREGQTAPPPADGTVPLEQDATVLPEQETTPLCPKSDATVLLKEPVAPVKGERT